VILLVLEDMELVFNFDARGDGARGDPAGQAAGPGDARKH
jgi:hypothetical protein